jgi:hypothetical protein
MHGLKWLLAAALLLNASPSLAQKPTSLPIAQGLWINAAGKCATVTNGYLFDGARWGAVYYYGPNGSMGPVAELEKIGRATLRKDGFTNMQLGETEGAGYFHVKSLAPGRMILRTGAPSPEGIQVMDDTLMLCTFASLSPKMKVALKRLAPALATATK